MKRLGTKHLEFLTDDFGIWQHTNGSEIDQTQGYALDDAARALLVAVKLNQRELAEIYITFIERALSQEPPANFYTAERQIWNRPWSPDAVAECYWGLAVAISNDLQASRCQAIITHFINPRLYELKEWLRAISYVIIGAALIDHPLALELTDQLLETYREHQYSDWPWPEDTLTYANAIIPYSLLEVGHLHGHLEAKQVGRQMLSFLNQICLQDSYVQLIGNQGWYSRGGTLSKFGQQPIEAAYSVLANVSAYRIFKDPVWLEAGSRYLNWFWGDNSSGVSLINLEDQSIADGIDELPRGINPNRGAENTVCYLYAQEEIWPLLETHNA